MTDYSTRSDVYAVYGNEFDAPGNFAKTGSGSNVKTASGGVVRTRTSAEIRSGSNSRSPLDSLRDKNRGGRNSNNSRKKPEIVDARGYVNRFDRGRIDGDTVATLRESHPKDRDESQNTTEHYLKRLKEKSNENSASSNFDEVPVAFEQYVGRDASTGAKRLDSPILRGTGFGSGESGAGGGGGQSAGVGSSGATIGLPTPDNLQENMNIGYESKQKGAGAGIQSAMMNAVASTLRNMSESGNPANSNMITNMKAVFSDMKSFYEKDGNIDNFLGAVGNMAGMGNFDTMFNNSMIQQFSGVMPRSFNFRWKLYADSEAGTQAIFKIIQILKEASHPELVDPYLNIVRYPARLKRFDIRSPNGLIIFPIFESVITDLTVDYSASGSPFFFKSGAPTSVALSLSITEITSKTRNDYARSPSGFA